MFGLSWGQISIIVLVGVFVLGPERIPTAVRWVLTGARKVRTMASGAQADLVRELGPEIADLRRQIAELQSMRQLPELRELLDLAPGRLIGPIPPDGPFVPVAGAPRQNPAEFPEPGAVDAAANPVPTTINRSAP